MKVYIVNVNNCEAYSDYWEGIRGVYSSREKAIDAMTAQGFDASTRIKIIPWYEDEEDWLESGWYDREEMRRGIGARHGRCPASGADRYGMVPRLRVRESGRHVHSRARPFRAGGGRPRSCYVSVDDC